MRPAPNTTAQPGHAREPRLHAAPTTRTCTHGKFRQPCLAHFPVWGSSPVLHTIPIHPQPQQTGHSWARATNPWPRARGSASTVAPTTTCRTGRPHYHHHVPLRTAGTSACYSHTHHRRPRPAQPPPSSAVSQHHWQPATDSQPHHRRLRPAQLPPPRAVSQHHWSSGYRQPTTIAGPGRLNPHRQVPSRCTTGIRLKTATPPSPSPAGLPPPLCAATQHR